MMKRHGHVLPEFVLVLVILLAATTGIISIYKKFWKMRYKKVSIPSNAVVETITQINYVK
jgi:hypothetical protein